MKKLIEVWRLQSIGRDDDAGLLLAHVWSWAMDGLARDRNVRVALRLLDRLHPVTDDGEAWEALPSELDIYRAESSDKDGLCWTLEQSLAQTYAEMHGLSVSRGTAAKSDVLAYITHYGEDEIVVRREAVTALNDGALGA